MIVLVTLLLLSVAIVRTAVPDRSRMRSVSIEAIDIPSERIESGQTIVRERDWRPPTDVYVVGWDYNMLAGPHGDLLLRHGETRVFASRGRGVSSSSSFFQGGVGYKVRMDEKLTLRFRLTNTGPPGETWGATALIYFVPVEGN